MEASTMPQVKKRDGRVEAYDGGKIVRAMRRAFEEAGAPADDTELAELLATVEASMRAAGVTGVEGIQDLVERALMERAHFDVAKRYILYRYHRSEMRAQRRDLARAVMDGPAPADGASLALADAVATAATTAAAGATAAGTAAAADTAAVAAAATTAAATADAAATAIAAVPVGPATPSGAVAGPTVPALSPAAEELAACLAHIQRDYPEDSYALSALAARFGTYTGADQDQTARLDALVRAAVELTSQEAPRWEMIAARLLAFGFNRALAHRRAHAGIETFSQLVRSLTDQGLYGDYITAAYSAAELDRAAAFMDPARDELFTYAGLDLLYRRYVISSHDHVPLESPQEMFLGIALHLAMNEDPAQRLAWVRCFYDMLSRLEVTMATPTMSNARKPDHQLSSCFIDTVPDSLTGIYRSVDNFAQVSKYGGGMGMYLGKVRATGGSIRGFSGVAGGVIRWIRVINDTAVAVDQLGMRQGAVAVYLDAWHRDLPEFLNLRTNNGDDRMKAHDVFPAVCYPDLFWRMAEESLDQDWYLMCPHDILQVKGYALEDSYGEQWERRYRDCVADPRIPKRTVLLKDLVRLILKSAVETGTPFAFMRDTVNRLNPHAQRGIIYCSNLCTEIAQNTSEIQEVSREVQTREGDTVVVTTTRPGDFVVCNLASLSLGRLPVEDDEAMGRVIECAVRALDNVIDLNFYALPYARLTNRRYRSIGLGVSGYHHMLARRGISWESEEHLAFADEVFERINYHAIAASERLAEERGATEVFAGSDWQTGAYFTKRGYVAGAPGEAAGVAAGMTHRVAAALAAVATGEAAGAAAGEAARTAAGMTHRAAPAALGEDASTQAGAGGSSALRDSGDPACPSAMGEDRWRELATRVAEHGVRNAYLLAIAPTSSTSILSGTTPGIDPIMRKFFLEEKKGTMLPRVVPELSPQTFWYYKPAHYLDQLWSVRAAGVRQRHIDQAQSMNLYITNDYTLRQVLGLYIAAWKYGVKTVYYVRSKSLEVEECESCSA